MDWDIVIVSLLVLSPAQQSEDRRLWCWHGFDLRLRVKRAFSEKISETPGGIHFILHTQITQGGVDA